jgi:hypothetical protein
MMEDKKDEDDVNEPRRLQTEDDENKGGDIEALKETNEEVEDPPLLPLDTETFISDQTIFRANFPSITDNESIPTDEENQVTMKDIKCPTTGVNETYCMSSDEDDNIDKEEMMMVAVMANGATTALTSDKLLTPDSGHPLCTSSGHDNLTKCEKLVGGILATVALSTIIIGVTVSKKENERRANESLVYMESLPTTSPSTMPSISLIPTISAHPTFSVEPTFYPTISFQPSYRPSTMPSISVVPTSNPSTSIVPTVTMTPTTTPTQQPTSSMSRLKLYWEPGYLWQNVNTEMFFCMECSNRNNICSEDDIIMINTCDTTASHQLFTIVGKTIRPAYDLNLCFTVMGYGRDIDTDGDPIPQAIELQQCDDDSESNNVFGDGTMNIMQQFTGYNSNGMKFEFSVDDKPERCLAQAHHPKVGEKIHTKLCTDSRADTTSYYITY